MNECMAEINVQTTVSDLIYESLWRVARAEKRPLKAVVREAIEAYLRQAVPPERDSLMAFVGRGRLKAKDWSERKDWRA